ncbi:MAG: N-6 DNA methylase [Blastocatellia bacterium]|nr:N-6 DNA methylase [Blastocatellia bacterium]
MFKPLVRQIDKEAQEWLPLSHDEELIAWASLHGWDTTDAQAQRLLARQTLLNAIIRQTITTIANHTFATPLDSFEVRPSQSITETISEAAQSLQVFNFWGDLYNALIPQSERRRIGQFWTGEQIADWMTAWLLAERPRRLIDVGCGAGNFLLKAAQLMNRNHYQTELHGIDLSPLLLNVALAGFLMRGEASKIPALEVRNYLDFSLPHETDAVICNPPYTRHHHIPPAVKDRLQAFFKTHLHCEVSRQGTMAFYFLLKLIAEMPEGARAAVIVPMEVLDARYGKAARRVLCQQTAMNAIIHFSPQMNAFHKVDVGASIIFFRKGYEKENRVRHLTLDALPETDELMACLETDKIEKRDLGFGSLVIRPQDDLFEVSKWFAANSSDDSKADWRESGLVVPLKNLARVMRGIATGANDFFVLPTEEVHNRSLEPYVVPTLHRNREVQDIILDQAAWQILAEEGKRVWLLYLNNGHEEADPNLLSYLAEGEAKGYHLRSLVQTRKRWYGMEQRDIPPIFYTLLTRGNPRFILNRAGVRPVNMFLLIYPNSAIVKADAVEILWALLNSDFSISRLHSVSRTYGGNTLKVEPRELDNLPVIDPLALPAQARGEIKQAIADFHSHREATRLTRRIDEIIKTLLSAKYEAGVASSLSEQLSLLKTK